jgi:hypothetical protein
MSALPVDYRRCRADPAPCAGGAESGSIWRTRTGEPVTAFVHVVDCRPGAEASARTGGYDCTGARRGHLYLQYWLYYTASSTAEGSIPGVKEGIRLASTAVGHPSYHRDDWESYQVRIRPDGGAYARASSHTGYKHAIGAGDELPRLRARVGIGGKRRLSLRAGRSSSGHWGPSSGSIYVSGGSHAGNVEAPRLVDRVTPASRIRLVPLEPIAARERARFAVTPPWLKRVWADPEDPGTD